jgi:hypothetical protein
MSDPDNGATEKEGENEESQQLPDVVDVPTSSEDSVQEVNNQVGEGESKESSLPDDSKSEDSAPEQPKRSVSFPRDTLIKGYLDPPNPWRNGTCLSLISE